MTAHLLLNENLRGTDWVVGDIHGEYDKLMDKLHQVGFDFDCDRLLCTGDLVDRGPRSQDVVYLLNEKWFFSTVGNHEIMLLDAYRMPWAEADFIRNGGLWWHGITEQEKAELAWLIDGLPISITFNVGIARYLCVHACVPRHDACYLKMAKDFNDPITMNAVWTRIFHPDATYKNWVSYTEHVPGFTKVFVGHTPVDKVPVMSDNYVNMDTGVVFYKEREFVLLNTRTGEFI